MPTPRAHALGLDDRPYLLCLGRVDDGKGARLLAECFAQYKHRRGGPLRLVFAGPVVNELPPHPDIVHRRRRRRDREVGPAPRCAGARVAERVRVVLDRADGGVVRRNSRARQPPLRGHPRSCRAVPAAASPSAATPSSKSSSIASPRRRPLRTALGRAGQRFVDGRYRWNDVIDRYATFVERSWRPSAGRHMYARK